MAHEFTYLQAAGLSGDERRDGMIVRMDKALGQLRESKGEFYTHIAEFLLEMRLFTIGLDNEKMAIQNAKFVSRFVGVVVKRVYGGDTAKLYELMEDVDTMMYFILRGEQ